MMEDDDLTESLKATFQVEGGFSDHAADPGGTTNLGVTWRTLKRARSLGLASAPRVRDLTVAEARTIYREMYWKPSGAHRLPSGVNAMVFDVAVNSGPRKAVLILQRSLLHFGQAVSIDGRFGPKTQAAAERVGHYKLINEIGARRHLFWTGLKTWRNFRKGWSRRGYMIHGHAVVMATLAD